MAFIAGISICLLIELLLLSKREKTLSDKVLFAWVLLIGLHLAFFYLQVSGQAERFAFLLGLEIPIPLLHGVFLYWYVAAMTSQQPKRPWGIFLHFLPALVSCLYIIVNFVGLTAQEKLAIYAQDGAGFEVFSTINFYAIQLSGIAYISWSVILLRRHRHNIREQFSNLEKINLQWLYILTLGLGIIWVIVIFGQVEAFTYLGVVVYVFLIAYFGIQQVGIFTAERPLISTEEARPKYAKSGLTEERSIALFARLQQLMETEGLYRDNELSLHQLATRLDVHPNYLSQLINEQEGKNFYDFVNTYRVEEFLRLITQKDRQQFTLLATAFECGFNSKSSFNRYFKKVTGSTPTQYLKK